MGELKCAFQVGEEAYKQLYNYTIIQKNNNAGVRIVLCGRGGICQLQETQEV